MRLFIFKDIHYYFLLWEAVPGFQIFASVFGYDDFSWESTDRAAAKKNYNHENVLLPALTVSNSTVKPPMRNQHLISIFHFLLPHFFESQLSIIPWFVIFDPFVVCCQFRYFKQFSKTTALGKKFLRVTTTQKLLCFSG